jgi:hypothetical protein
MPIDEQPSEDVLGRLVEDARELRRSLSSYLHVPRTAASRRDSLVLSATRPTSGSEAKVLHAWSASQSGTDSTVIAAAIVR